MKFGIRNWVQLGCVALAMSGVVNFWFALEPVDTSALEDTGRNPARKPSGREAPPSTAHFDLTEALARPVFSPIRREFEPPPEVTEEEPQAIVAAPPAVEASPTLFALHGTRNILSRPAALISLSDKSNGQWYEVGQSIDGWQLVAVQPDGISVLKADTRLDIKLFDPSDAQNAPN